MSGVALESEAWKGQGEIPLQILSACKKPISIDDLLAHINMPLPELQTLLFNMQLDGMIQQNFAGLWESN